MSRWNFSYSVPVSFSSGNASFEDGSVASDYWEKFLNSFLPVIVIIALIIEIIAAIVILNVVGTILLGGTTMMILDILAISALGFELLYTHRLGDFEGCDEYNSNWLARFLYHYICDWDGTTVRIVVMNDKFDPFTIRFTE
ncbi:MAG: hypothetical protein ACFFB5_16765 [Promethearchaeota archaeon]